MDYQKKDGMLFAPKHMAKKVVNYGEFPIGVIGLDHGHIYGMCNGLTMAGANIKLVYDSDMEKCLEFLRQFPEAKIANNAEEIYEDKEILMIASASIPSDRCDIGIKAIKSGKHYFADKPAFTTLAQIENAKKTVNEYGKKYMVYYAERLHVESAIYAGELIKAGEIGDVMQVIGLGPHRINIPARPQWFFERMKYGGIICDIGSHQIEQYLYYAGEEDAEVTYSQRANYAHPNYPELDDFGDCLIQGKKGTTNYFRVDWFTPDGLNTWGDGRTMILGTKGYIELRKYINIGTNDGHDHIFIANDKIEKKIDTRNTVGCPFFGELILDCLNGTEKAMTQKHAFLASELAVTAQEKARVILAPSITKNYM